MSNHQLQHIHAQNLIKIYNMNQKSNRFVQNPSAIYLNNFALTSDYHFSSVFKKLQSYYALNKAINRWFLVKKEKNNKKKLTFSWSIWRSSLISRRVLFASILLSKALAIFLIATLSFVSEFIAELQNQINTRHTKE